MTERVFKQIARSLGADYLRYRQLGGGDTGRHYKLYTSQGAFFVKTYPYEQGGEMIASEVFALEQISATQSILTAQVQKVYDSGNQKFLILKWIDTTRENRTFWAQFAEDLAVLHTPVNKDPGYPEDNFIGKLKQNNKTQSNWSDFYIHNRLYPQIAMAFDAKLLDTGDVQHFEHYINRVSSLLEDKISLLHGDLWRGNVLCTPHQRACLIDPASYYGHPLVDLAMTKLFGGFPSFFYQIYTEKTGIQLTNELIELYQLYPLMVHLNLFGRSYAPTIRQIINR